MKKLLFLLLSLFLMSTISYSMTSSINAQESLELTSFNKDPYPCIIVEITEIINIYGDIEYIAKIIYLGDVSGPNADADCEDMKKKYNDSKAPEEGDNKVKGTLVITP